MSTNYSVVVNKFAERHYIKKYEKKYKSDWDATKKGILEGLKRFDMLLDTSIAEEIICVNDISICKVEFRVARTKSSRKNSGNRYIIAVHKKNQKIYILFVYHKNDLKEKNETAQWKKIIRENYKEYSFCK
jgi:hypothetical protein